MSQQSARELTHTSNRRQDAVAAAGQAPLQPQMGASSPLADHRYAESGPGAAPTVMTGILIVSEIRNEWQSSA